MFRKNVKLSAVDKPEKLDVALLDEGRKRCRKLLESVLKDGVPSKSWKNGQKKN